MADVNDPRNRHGRVLNEKANVADLAHDGDRKAIRSWAASLTQAPSTKASHINRVRTFAERSDTPLVEMDEAEYYVMLDTYEDGTAPGVEDGGLKPGTLRNVRQSTKLFFRDGLGREWAEDVKVGAPERTNVTGEDIFLADEVDAMLDACNHPRDKALVAFLTATGQRATATLSLKVGDFGFRDDRSRNGIVELNEDAIGLKGASGPRPLLWATEYVKNWVDVHPRRDDDDAPLFCTLKSGSGTTPEGESYEFERGEALSGQQLGRRLRRIGREAGVYPDKNVNAHAFRHTAISAMVRDGTPEQEIKWIVGWAKDSSQFERYTHLSDDEMLDTVLESYGFEVEDEPIGRPTFDTCPACDAHLGEFHNPVACPGCGQSLSYAAAKGVGTAEGLGAAATETAVESTDSDTIALAQALREVAGGDDGAAVARIRTAIEMLNEDAA